MEELIELYLLRNKKCPLLSFGGLQVIDNHTTVLYREGKIEPSVPLVKLLKATMPADDLINFIASKKKISQEEASFILNEFCSKLQQLDAYDEIKLPVTGKFYVNAEGELVFKSIEIPKQFLPEIFTEKVIHPAVPHLMVVGDKETTTTEMAAFFTEKAPSSKDRWWIWAACLVVVASALLGFQFKDIVRSLDFGNRQHIEIPQPANTHFIAE